VNPIAAVPRPWGSMTQRWSCARCGPRSPCGAPRSPRPRAPRSKRRSVVQRSSACLRAARSPRANRRPSRHGHGASGSPWPSCSWSRSSSCLSLCAACGGSSPRQRQEAPRRSRRTRSRRPGVLPARRARSPARPRQRRPLRRRRPSRRRTPRRPWRPPPRGRCVAPRRLRSRVRIQTSLTPGGASPWLICFCTWTAPNTPP
jgi:hypothetical protein